MMSRKDYVANGMNTVLHADNPRFDAKRFYVACGLETA